MAKGNAHRTSVAAVAATALLLLGVGIACAPRDAMENAAITGTVADHPVHFRKGELCARCHSNAPDASAMRTSTGLGVAPFDLWRGTMMANASRDPLWRAMVSAEIAARPATRAKIEAKCMTCHAPAAVAERRQHGGTPSFADFNDPRLAAVANDGANCTVCHGIEPEGLGTDESFSGNWTIGHDQRAYGPHANPFPMPMRPQTGWTPTEGHHILESALCATCHTLITETLDADGEPTGSTFPEQTPYLEWRASAYSTEREDPAPEAASCQDCHLPKVDETGVPISTRIARNPRGLDFGRVVDRSPFGMHLLVGGNALVPELLAAHHEEFGVEASAAALGAVAERVRAQLAERTARIAVERVRRSGKELFFTVAVTSLTGHKVPSGHPTRRMWLEVQVLGEDDAVHFASGRTDARGRLLGTDGAPLPAERAGGPLHPWPSEVTDVGQVPVFEMVMAGEDGAPTFSLLSAATTRKDTRLLPKGWDAAAAARDRIGAVAVPDDGTFAGGRATVDYRIPLPAGAGNATIAAALRYQTLGGRYAEELRTVDTPEVKTLFRVLDERGNAPETVGTVVRRVVPMNREAKN